CWATSRPATAAPPWDGRSPWPWSRAANRSTEPPCTPRRSGERSPRSSPRPSSTTPKGRAVTDERVAVPDLAVSDLAFPAQVDLRAPADEAGGRLALPLEPNTRIAVSEGVDVLWLGPDEWL